ncbi:MAG: hypothetical protein U0531_19510 [Dehalococcoidia bacterium]
MNASNGHRRQAEETPHLPEVQEGEAAPEVRAVFEDIAATLRVPFVGLFWRVVAAEPATLRLAWEAVAPNLRTWAAERAADTLRGRALIAEAAEISSHKAFKGDLVRAEIDYDLRTKINNFNHVARYALPKHLLAVTMLAAALEGAAVGGANGDTSEIPRGVAAGAVPVSPLYPPLARGRAAELLPRIATAHGHPTAEDYFRSLARLPDYLSAAWNVIKPVVGDEEYVARGESLVALAKDFVRGLPYPVVFPAGRLSPEQVGDIGQLLRLFRDSILPQTLMDAAIITVLTDGPDLAGHSPYRL